MSLQQGLDFASTRGRWTHGPGKAEDDGWVLDLVWNGARQASDLVILDARDLSEVALLELPLPVPHGLHGSWAPTH